MEINASSTLGSAASTDQSIRLANEETNNEKPSEAQEKSPSSPSSVEVNISATGAALSASEESDTENSPEQDQEATQSAEVTRLQGGSEEASETSPEQLAEELNTAIQQNPGSALEAQANASRSEVESLIAA